MEIPRALADAMVQHALDETPNECCGVLASKEGRVVRHYRMTNTAQSPYRYSMDGKELLATYREIEDNGWDLGVIYHSHTHSAAYPSATDVRLATWPDADYLLISLMDEGNPDLRNYSIVDEKISEAPLTIVD